MTPHVDAGLAYARNVVAGVIDACKWVRLACERHLKDLEKKDWPYEFDAAKAERVCNFMELMPHTKGRWAANHEKLRLEPFQCFLTMSIFGWVKKETGARRFRETYIELPRKNGKSLWAAAVGNYMFAADGEHGAEVYSGATSEKQAWEIFRPARLMAQRTPEFCDAFGVGVNASNLHIEHTGSRFEPLIGSPGDGASPSCALIDEYHEHQRDDLYETMITGMGAREQPLALIVTTAGSNLAGPCYTKRDYVTKILSGFYENDEIFGIIFTLDEEDDWATEEALKKANPNYGVSVSADFLLSQQREALQSATKQTAFKTKHLNLWVGAMQAWMNMQSWLACPERKPLDQLLGRQCYIGLDLASKVDIAALVLLFPPTLDDPLWHLHGRYYLPEAVLDEKNIGNASHYDAWAKQGYITLTPGNVIDYEYIKDDLREFSSQFAVKEIAFDPWQATQLAQEMLAEKAPMVEVRQTVAHMSEAMKSWEALVREKKFAHGNCPAMNWMISNVVARLDAKDNIYPVKELPQNKIDGPVGVIMALSRAIVQPAPKASVYEERGIL